MVRSEHRITDNVSTEGIVTTLPIAGDIKTTDLAVAFAPPLVLFTLVRSVPVVGDFSFAILGIGIALGFLGLAAVPDHTSLSQYAGRLYHHKRRPGKVRHKPKGGDEVLERGLLQYDSRTQEETDLKMVYPEHDVIEVQDGSIIGAIKINPPNLDTAEDEERRSIVSKTKSDFYDSEVDFDMTVYITTHGFEPDAVSRPYREQLNRGIGEDVLRFHAEQHLRWMDTFLKGEPVREYYVIVRVEEGEVYEELAQEGTVTSGLTDVPIIGTFAGSQSASEEIEDGLKAEQADIVNSRLNVVQQQLAGSLGENSSTKRLSAAEHVAILKEFWQGEQMTREEMESLVDITPITVGEADMYQMEGGSDE